MKNKANRPATAAELRRRAEEKTISLEPQELEAQSPEETRQTLHELRVHQIELEMQNAELRRTQVELDAARARYFDLYDLAPVGYCTVSEKGLILEANLTVATLLGTARDALVKQPISRFIHKEDQDIYYRHRKKLFETGMPQVCEFRMLREDTLPFWVRLEATTAQGGEGSSVCRAVVSDITKRKQAEEVLQQVHDELERRVAERTEELRQANEKLRTEITERKQAEEARRERDANFRNMVDQLADVFFATDNSAFITFISPSAVQMFGWKPEDMVDRNFIEFLSDADIPCAVEQFQGEMASGQSIKNLPFIMKRKDGSTFPGELNSSVIWKDGRTAGAIGIIRDITERKQAEEALKNSEERYRNQVESINDVAYAIGNGGEITYISPVVRNVLGYEPDEITGRRFLEFVHQEDSDLLKRQFAELREGILRQSEYRIIGKHGDIKWMRSMTTPIFDIEGFAGGRGILMDMTERKHTEEALRRAEENFRRSLDDSPLGVRIVDEEGETLYANWAILDIYGYDTLEELKTIPIKNRYTPESYAEFRIRREKRRQGIDDCTEYTINIIRKNGEVRHLQVFRKEVLWNGERRYQVIYQDITERKNLEARLIQVQKMEALGTLSSGIAHDFNNILAAVIGYTELAIGASDEARRRSDMEQVLQSCDRARSLITQILAFSRTTPHEYQPLEIGPIVKEGLKLLRASLPTTIEFHRRIASEPAMISGDPTQIHQVLMNLCTNAAHAMGEKGGTLEVTLSPVEVLLGKLPPSPDLHAGSYMRLTVSDTGHGIDPAIMNRIFDPFFTTKSTGEGTGLGLSVVYGIARSHGGGITVQSEPGKGSSFSIYFPRVETKVKPEIQDLKELPMGSERVLFVDDETELAHMGRMMLETLGYEVMPFTNSDLACRAFVSHPDGFDLVITDMTMPVMTGVALSREILKIRPEMPVILCTGHSEFIDEKKAKDAGIRKFLMKPIFMKDLARVIREVLDGSIHRS